MPRRNARAPVPPPRAPAGGGERRVQWHGDTWVVRAVTGAAAVKSYRCPACLQEIRPGVPHVVAWAADDPDAQGRRHWHTGCWSARERRGPGR